MRSRCGLAVAILLPVMLSGCPSRQVERTSKANSLLIMAVARVVTEVHAIRQIEDGADAYTVAHKMKAHLDNASRELDDWRKDDDPDRVRIVKDMDYALSALHEAANALLRWARSPAAERRAIFDVKLEQGRKGMLSAAIGILPYSAGGRPATVTGKGVLLTEEDRGTAGTYVRNIAGPVVQAYKSGHPEASLETGLAPEIVALLTLEVALNPRVEPGHRLGQAGQTALMVTPTDREGGTQ